METAIVGLLAETPIHAGSGRSVGVIDLPVAREAATEYPVLVGSSLKGALRDKAETMNKSDGGVDVDVRFGAQDRAGDLIVSDGRMLQLPVRSLTGAYRWATCPHLLERYGRDLERAGRDAQFASPKVKQGKTLAAGDGDLYLEERQFDVAGSPDEDLVNAIAPLALHDETRDRLAGQVAVLNDNDFAWFARFGLSVQARNVLDDDAKSSENLWYEETLPPDTVMYALAAGRSDGALDALDFMFPDDDPYLQVGGNPKLNWIKTVAGKSIGQTNLIEEASLRLARLAERRGGRWLLFTAESRFATGLGRSHPVENGFAWHPTLGTLYLSGSSVKGMVRAWARGEGVEKETIDRILGKQEEVGSISFMDALPVGPVQLEADVMTPHYAGWDANDPPGDWRSPTPIPFLATASETSFLFAIAPRGDAGDKDVELV